MDSRATASVDISSAHGAKQVHQNLKTNRSIQGRVMPVSGRQLVRVPAREISSVVAAASKEIDPTERDEMAIPSYSHWNPLIRWLMWRRLAEIGSLLQGRDGDACLDFGCGIGLLLPTLCEHFDTVYAIDLHPQVARELVRRRGLNVTFLDDVNSLDCGRLDVITATDVLEHVDDLPSCIRRLSDKLRPDGRLLVSGPTENGLYKLGRIAAGFAGKGDYHHTDIDAIAAEILAQDYMLSSSRSLPFRAAPLFKVLAFTGQGPEKASEPNKG